MLRRERVTSALWVGLIVIILVALAPGMAVVLDADSRAAMLPMLDLPAMVSMIGPNFAAAHPESFGAMFTTFMMLFTALTVGLMNIFLVIRLSRADEERGRYEVLRSLPIGRLSPIGATLIVAVLVNIALAVLMGLGLWVAGDASMDFHGSMLWGVTLGVFGLVMAGVAALFSQLSSSSRGATGYSFMVLAVFYLMRAPGDMNADMEILSLISPMGLLLRTQAYMENNWWPIWIMLATAAAFAALALRISAKRDIDQGIIPDRAGRERGGLLMKRPFGLTWKLAKTSIIVWLVGMFILSASYGTVLDGIDEFIAGNELYQQVVLGPHGLVAPEGLELPELVAWINQAVAEAGFVIAELFISMTTSMMGMFAMVPVIMLVKKALAEERDTRTEKLFAASVCRVKYLAGHVGLAFGMAVAVQFMLALGMYVVSLSVLEGAAQLSFSFLLQANLAYVPALLVIGGLATLLVGAAPRFSGLIWGYFAYTFIVMFVGRIVNFPEWLVNLTPFAFIPQLPLPHGEGISWLALGGLTMLGFALAAAGLWFYRNRDINAVTA
jgi:ABC-2 type transport system permease protein